MPTRHMSKNRNRGASLGRLWIRGRVWDAESRVGQGSGRDPRSGVDQVAAAGSGLRDGFGRRVELEIWADH